MRWVAVLTLVVVAGAGLGVGVYSRYFRAVPLAAKPQFTDTGDRLPTAAEFEKLVRTDPVKMLEACMKRYQREVKSGMTATLHKRERIYGEPKPPAEPNEEVMRLAVMGDVPDESGSSKVRVRMVWVSGARRSLGGTVHGTLYVEELGGGKDKITVMASLTAQTPVNGLMAKGASRYCMRDAGLYGAMLRSHTVWKKRQDEGLLEWRFVEKRAAPEVGGRECFIVERTCPNPEVDPFEIGGEPNLGGRNPEAVGSVRIRLYIDTERWLQAGSELYRADGRLLGSYYFRDVNLDPNLTNDVFTPEALKKAVASTKK